MIQEDFNEGFFDAPVEITTENDRIAMLLP
jgi:hypothetical protein